MKVKLSGGEALLRINIDPVVSHEHNPCKCVKCLKAGKVRGEEACRKTIVAIKLPDGTEVSGTALCSPLDNFVRRTGRRLATQKLVSALKTMGVSKEDRLAVVQALIRGAREKKEEAAS